MAEEAGKDPGLLRRQWRRISEIPFNSDKKYMGAICSKGGEKILFVKGAVDVLLSKCSLAVNPSFQEEETASWGRPFSFSDKERILRQNGLWSKKGMRVLALACKPLKEEEIRDAKAENMIFLGLAAMTDPPRPESKMAVADAKKAGIRTVMITGDHKETAAAIASEIGIFTAGDLAVTGADLDQMSDQQLQERLEKISVYARVSPEHKIRIVEAWQKKGHITAMTGDGVNDAPALKKADIGIAMGKAGTEVSRDAAAMILTDDNFATIIKAVANGRNVYRNIKNSTSFCCPEIWQGSFVYCIHLSRRFHCLLLRCIAVYQPADRLPSCHCHRYGTGRPGSFKPASQRPKRRDPFFSICREDLIPGFSYWCSNHVGMGNGIFPGRGSHCQYYGIFHSDSGKTVPWF